MTSRATKQNNGLDAIVWIGEKYEGLSQLQFIYLFFVPFK